MILLKANNELRNVFARMIATMGAKVEWKGNFVVLNHFLILSGRVRSLVLNFENRKVGTNVIELPDREEDMEQVEGNEILANVLNMSLYAFGKWGMIKGLKVDQDDQQLNGLFSAVLKDLKIRPDYRSDHFRFYQEGVQVTYEEVVQAAIEEGKRKAQEPQKEPEKAERERKAGLWHNMCWRIERCAFSKEETDAYERTASRLGNNFYITGYLCPSCKAKLYMCVYPQGKEFPVETEEGKVYLARSYTCDSCSLYYTPRPGKLLREGDAYALKFGKDRDAYEDYRELLGQQGARVSNYNFNEYAADRGKGKEGQSVEEACANMEQMSEKELQDLDEKLEAGFFPLAKAKPYRKKLAALLRRRKKQEGASGRTERSGGEGKVAGRTGRLAGNAGGRLTQSDNVPQNMAAFEDTAQMGNRHSVGNTYDGRIREGERRSAQDGWQGGESASGGKSLQEGTRNPEERTGNPAGERDLQQSLGSVRKGGQDSGQAEGGNGMEKGHSRTSGADADPASGSLMEKYASRLKVLDRMSLRQMQELEKQVQKEARLGEPDRIAFLAPIREAIVQKEQEIAWQKARGCQGKPYAAIVRTMEEISRSGCPEEAKGEALKFLQELKQIQAQQEAEQLMANLPLQLNQNQYRAFCNKLSQYEGVDISAYEGQLEERRRLGQRQELTRMMGRIGKSSRSGLMQMLQQINEEGFPNEDTAEIQQKIEERIRALDEQAIDQICPDILGLSFDDAIEAYEKIEGGAFLPELKTNTLEMIDKRLTKIKMDECGLLVEKLRDDLKAHIRDAERIHYYDVRSVMRGDWDPQEAALVAMALNTYARERHRYEYPIIVCDSSGKKNGREGFVLTPDHIFYNSAFSSEAVPIRSVVRVEGNTGLLSRGLYLSRGNGVKTKIPGGIPAKELRAFGEALNRFVSYLQEKPESRSIAYLAKDKHEVKCCYRCGYHYREGDICPKCGKREPQGGS